MRLKRKIAVLFVLIMAGMSSLAMAADLPVTSPFGWRVHPITGTWKFHAGVDLGYEAGSGVPALWDGQVVQCGNFDDGYGNQVMLYHAAVDAYTRYAHLSAKRDGASFAFGVYCQRGRWFVSVHEPSGLMEIIFYRFYEGI